MGRMTTLWSRLRIKAIITMFPVVHRVDDRRTDLVRIGSEYGGWWVPTTSLTADSICYTAGIGTDITFDLGLVERFGCQVWGIDPTPEAIAFTEGQPLPAQFTLVPTGLFGENGRQRFYVPRNADHVSHSLKNLQQTDEFFEAEVVTVRTLMEQLGHRDLDLLKLDIEGAEHETVQAMVADGVRPRVLCIEYDQPEPLSWSVRTTQTLRATGYWLVKVDGLNLTFILP